MDSDSTSELYPPLLSYSLSVTSELETDDSMSTEQSLDNGNLLNVEYAIGWNLPQSSDTAWRLVLGI